MLNYYHIPNYSIIIYYHYYCNYYYKKAFESAYSAYNKDIGAT